MKKITNIFYFNPTCEMAIANGSPYYQPPAILREFEDTLSSLMLWFANENDILIRNKPANNDFSKHLSKIGLDSSNILTKKDAFSEITNKKEHVKLMPWGWSPATQKFFKDIDKFSTQHINRNAEYYRSRFERKNAIEILKELIEETQSKFLIPEKYLPELVYSEGEINNFLNRWGNIVLKAPVSSSGRGLQIIRKEQLSNSKKQWINTILKQQRYIVCEPLLEKRVDFSFQFHIDSEKNITYLGTSYFNTNRNGQYQGHFLNLIPQAITDFQKSVSKNMIDSIALQIQEKLQKSIYQDYESYIGIDALIFEQDGVLKLQPCIEINPRFNMGALSLKIQEKIHYESNGTFEIYKGKSYSSFVRTATKKNPLKFMNGKLLSGFYSLTEANNNQVFGAYINLNAD